MLGTFCFNFIQKDQFCDSCHFSVCLLQKKPFIDYSREYWAKINGTLNVWYFFILRKCVGGEICALYEEEMCLNWFTTFFTGDFLLKIAKNQESKEDNTWFRREPTYLKIPDQLLTVICAMLVILVSLFCGFHTS